MDNEWKSNVAMCFAGVLLLCVLIIYGGKCGIQEKCLNRCPSPVTDSCLSTCMGK